MIELRHDIGYRNIVEIFEQVRLEFGKHYKISPSLILPTNGATGALNSIISAAYVKDMRDHRFPMMLLGGVEYFDVKVMGKLSGYNLAVIEEDLKKYPTESVARSLRDDKPGVFYVSLPNNPTGRLLPQEELEFILDNVQEGTRVVIDKTLVHPDQYLVLQRLCKDYADKDVVVVDSFSKSRGLVESRVGILFAVQPWTINSVPKYAQLPSSRGMVDAIRFLKSEWVKDELFDKIKQSNEWLSEVEGYIPSKSNFAVIEVEDGERVTKELAAKGYLVRSGKQLSVPDNFIRIDMGQPEMMEGFVKALNEVRLS